MVRLHPDVTWRVSRRGLVLASPGCGSVLFEHPRSADLVDLLAADPSPEQLRAQLGPPLDDDLVEVLLQVGILTAERGEGSAARRPRGVELSATGIAFPGVARPARWLARHLVPALASRAGRVALVLVLGAGVAALLAGRPDLPEASSAPAGEAILMLLLLLLVSACHELGHAVALVHYGRTPTTAGLGFYWGSLSFYVDSTPALTLERRQRVAQALAGLGVDVVALALCAVAAHLAPWPLLSLVFWRTAVLGLAALVVNASPILEVDGHWALADWLDEPDLSPRARRSLGAAVRGHRPDQPWLAWYGGFSLAAGLLLIAWSAYVFWATAGGLMRALFAGGATDVAVGLYCLVPLVLGLLASGAGLLLDLAGGVGAPPTEAVERARPWQG